MCPSGLRKYAGFNNIEGNKISRLDRGIAHGGSGYSICFTRLFGKTKKRKYLNIALELLKYDIIKNKKENQRSKGPCEEISVEDVKKELERIEYCLQENDIVLIRTDTDKKWGKPNYFYEAPGMSREATKFLVESGVKIIGIDCYSLDKPFMAMVKQYYRTNDKKCLWPAHFYGREKEYCHIERLTNLDKIPMNYGFKFCCFPIKLKEMGAAWVRAVAIIE